jgi:glycosyltransferase involved in cell wall biosynthesis
MITAIHLPVSYFPWTVGGKEMFTHSLAKAQTCQGIKPTVAIHQDHTGIQSIGTHQHEGIPVEVMPSLMGTTTRRAVYGCVPDAAPGFEELLQQRRPDIVHFQDFSVGANLLHMRAAKAAGCGIVMTYHSPGQVCTQRSLLFRGQSVCDGRLDEQRCTRCRLGVLGVPEWVASGISRIGNLGFPVDTTNRLGRALTVRATVRLFQRAWAECVSLVDRFTVHADWCAELLLANGVPCEKLVMVRSGWHGTASPGIARQRSGRSRDEPLRLAFVGRADPVKGLHVLVEAVRSLPHSLPIEVGFFGPYWCEAYGAGLARQVQGDNRFQPPELLAPADLMQRLADYDVCVVPSLWLETGPLVVLEAFAVGLPVVGSRLGGIAELVTVGQDGLLFEPGNAAELAACLRRLVDDPALLEQLRSGIRSPRTMADVAQEMADLYREVIDEKTQAA